MTQYWRGIEIKFLSKIDLKKRSEFDNHKTVFEFRDQKIGLEGFLAIHNDRLGVPVGGTRMYPYKKKEDALCDVLALSRAMSYKCALSGVSHGGGKGVIIGDAKKLKTKKILSAYAQVIDFLHGNFYTGEDVGISEKDVQFMLQTSPYFIGKSELAGDPSPFAALSTFNAMEEAVRIFLGDNELRNHIVSIKGVGKVGGTLLEMLSRSGVKLKIADISSYAIKHNMADVPNLEVIDPEEIAMAEVDVYSPCALGNEFTVNNWQNVKAKIICGAANNQLTSPDIGDFFFNKGIIYIVDYLANCGGLINVVDELEPNGYQKSRVLKRIDHMKVVLNEIYTTSMQKKIAPLRIADEIAEEKFKS